MNALFVWMFEHTICPGRSQHNLNTKYADAADSMFKLMLTDPPLHIYLLLAACIRMSLECSACSLEMQPLENCYQLCLVEGQVW